MTRLSDGREAGIDAARVVELARLLGADRLGELFDILCARLNMIKIGLEGQSGRQELIDMVHQSRGSASNLGLLRMARRLGILESDMRRASNKNPYDNVNSVNSAAKLLTEFEVISLECSEDRAIIDSMGKIT